MISHAIFASFHLTPPRTALSSTPPSTPRFAPHLALHFTPLHIPPCTPTQHPIMRFTQHLDPHSHPYPSAKSLLPPVRQFPIRVSPPSVSLSQVPPADFLVRKKARFTHDMTFFRHDVRGKRFNAHGESHNMEMTIIKNHVAEKPGRG